MFLCVFILVLVNACSGNRYEAAEAIQYAIFGDDTITDSPTANNQTAAENTDNVTEGPQPVTGPVYYADSQTATATHMHSSRHTTKAHTTVGTESPHTTQYGRHHHHGHSTYSAAAQHLVPSSGSGGTRAGRRPTTTPPPQGKKKAFSGQSYSFKQLSGMSANSAPNQAGNFYVPREYERIPRVEPCQAVKCHLSIAIVMDSSGSVGYDDYQKELSFVKTLLEILAVKAVDSKLKVCTGLVSYSTDVHVEVDPCCENSICRVVDQFHARRLEYRSGSTNTHGALKVARQMLQAAASHKKVALLITDGKSNTGGSPVPFAKRMRDEDGIQIVALGVTNDVNRFELKGVSGMDRVTKIDVFDEFHELASILLQANKVASQYELETSFDAMCYQDKSFYKENQCIRVVTEEQKSQCVWGEWSNCVRRGSKCSQTKTCKLSGIVIMREDQACECPPCEPGKYLNVVDQHCLQCAANTYSNTETTACISCPADKVSDPGSASIKDCVNEFEVVDADGHIVTGEEEGLLLYKGGTVCDDYFSDAAANAICRQMGRPYGGASWKNGQYYSFQGQKSIKLDDVTCHSDIWASCTFETTHNCSHSEDVHIACKGNKGSKPTKPTTQPPTKKKTDNKSESPSPTTAHYHQRTTPAGDPLPTTRAPGHSLTA